MNNKGDNKSESKINPIVTIQNQYLPPLNSGNWNEKVNTEMSPDHSISNS